MQCHRRADRFQSEAIPRPLLNIFVTRARLSLQISALPPGDKPVESVESIPARLLELGRAELLGQVVEELPADLAVRDHKWLELPEGQPITGEVGGGGDRRRPHALVDQRNLAE